MTIFHKAPGKLPRRRVHLAPTAVLLLLALCSLALADDPIFRVARVSLVLGEVSYQQGKDSGESGKDWFDATLNLPLEENDQLYSGSDGRAEIQLSGCNVVRIDHDTNLRITQFNSAAIQLALPIGSAWFRIDSLDKRKFDVVDENDPGINDPVYFEVDTPTVAVTFVKEGVYRVNVRDDGSTEVIVRQGEAEVYNQEIGTVVAKKDRRVVVEGRGDLHRLTGLENEDDWDRWNDARDQGLSPGLALSDSSQYIPDAIPGASDLDSYGEWIDTEEYGRMWSPRGVDADWAPYRDGYWRWFPSYGWTWVSYEPWGWTPYHYGRWAYVRDRWCWAPFINVNIGVGSGWRWRPHHVAFFGWGGDYNRGYRDGYYDGYWNGFRDGRYGWLGWCPLSPRDRHYGNAPRLEALGNFRARGGISGMDARRFVGGRAHVTRAFLNAPVPAGDARRDGKRFAALAFVRNEDLKPLQRITPTRSDAVARSRFARKIEAPIIFRRTPGSFARPGSRSNRDDRNRDDRNREGWNRDDRNRDDRNREGWNRDDRNRNDRNRDGWNREDRWRDGRNSNASEPTRNPNDRGDRPRRERDYRPAERIAAPPPRSRESREPGESRETKERKIEALRERIIERARERGEAPPRNERPSRDERRSDNDRRRHNQPDRPHIERRETPRQPEQRREMRRPDPPSRDNSPRRVERPSPPPPAPARPSSPPPNRGSAPPRPPERSGPRRPNIQ